MSNKTESITDLIKKAILQAVNRLQGQTLQSEVKLEHPKVASHGDYSTNIALTIPGNPFETSQKIAAELNANQVLKEFVEKVEAVKPGFINISINPSYLITQALKVLKDKECFGTQAEKNEKIMVEFAHPNTHKLFHIGHLRNITTGESIVRILESNGYKVIRANYQGDVGLHIAKCLWGIKNVIPDPAKRGSGIHRNIFIDSRFRGNDKLVTLDDKIAFLGKCYSAGHKAYETDENSKKEIISINKKIYDKSDSQINKLWQETRSWSLEYFERIYKKVYSHFDRYYFESEVFIPGRELVLKNVGKIFAKSQGAIIFPGKKFGLHDRVFINSEGNATYEGKDIGLCQLQFSEFDPAKIIHVVAPEQTSYFQVLFKALEQVFPETKDRESHLKYGWVRLKKGKMSSREGNVILGEWLIDEAKNRVAYIMANIKKTALEEVDREEVSQTVAVGAVKYSFLKQGVDKDLSFDFDESVSFEGNSGPYLQYTYARCKSVLQRANFQFSIFNFQSNPKFSVNKEELEVLRTLYKYPEVVSEAAKNLNPSLICTYLYDLACIYNTFYNKNRILNDAMKQLSNETISLRLLLTAATAQILKNGLNLLGIKTVEKM